MRFRAAFLLATLALSTNSVRAQDRAAAEVLPLEGDRAVHDPVIIQANSTYYVFSTGRSGSGHIPIRCSTDLLNWRTCGRVFDALPAWTTAIVPGARDLWAPDISFINGEFRLYYSVSTFGSNRSAIGLVINVTLDPASPDYRWVDRGMVLSSQPSDDWNAIDPNLIVEPNGRAALAFGSFWSGIKMRRIDLATGKLSSDDSTLYSLARRASPGAVEAAFLIRKGSFYYLFASFDFCCRGVESTYNVVVGRSATVEGPYVDMSGRPMLQGGGTLLIEGTTPLRGPGHPAVLQNGKGDLFAFHTYDGVTGASRLQISTMVWENGWPRVGVLPGYPQAKINGVVNAASGEALVAPNTFLSIHGENFTSTTAPWDLSVVDQKLPVVLGGVRVRVAGREAFLAYVSRSQINVLTPAGIPTGNADVEVITDRATVTSQVLAEPVSPALFTLSGASVRYPVALFGNESVLVAPAGAVPGAISRPAKPGDFIQLYATGLGSTDPQPPAGLLFPQPYPIADPSRLQVTLGELPAAISYAGLIAPGLFQLNIRIPEAVPSGNQAVSLSAGGRSSQAGLVLSISR